MPENHEKDELMEETDHLHRSPRNAEILHRSIAEAEAGKLNEGTISDEKSSDAGSITERR